MAMQRNYFTVLFFLKKSKLLKNGEAPICMRITINGKRAEVQIKRSIDVTKWNTQKECAIGREKKWLTRFLVGLGIKFHQPKEKELDINYSSKLCPELFDFCIE